MTTIFPFEHHPCWSSSRRELWERIHLPIAKRCNLRCIYCDTLSGSCHSIGPGSSRTLFSVEDAWQILVREYRSRNNLHIVGISGPGEPLFNPETFRFLEKVKDSDMDLRICLSTNGTLLSRKIQELRRLGVASISISISTVTPEIAARIYGVHSVERGESIIEQQLEGIRRAKDFHIPIKANTIFIPGINSGEMESIAQSIKEAGCFLQNIVPLVPRGELSNHRQPYPIEIEDARRKASIYMPQFCYCKQCRSDVVGIPGNDTILSLD